MVSNAADAGKLGQRLSTPLVGRGRQFAQKLRQLTRVIAIRYAWVALLGLPRRRARK